MASAVFDASFTKAVTSASLTMARPIAASAPITAASLTVGGSIPDDAALTVRLTNNAADEQPVWQDATEAVRQGENVLFANQTAANGPALFANQTAANGPAFNFRVEVSRGPSGTGGYIDSVSGAFQ